MLLLRRSRRLATLHNQSLRHTAKRTQHDAEIGKLNDGFTDLRRD